MDELWTSMKQLLEFSRSPTHSFDYNPATNVSLPLIDAVVKGRIDIVRQLLACGADPNAEDWRGHSAFHMSSMGSNPVMLQLLLDNGGDVHVKSEGGHRNGMTALGFAVCGDEKELVRILMAAGATTGPHELSEYGMRTYRSILRELIGVFQIPLAQGFRVNVSSQPVSSEPVSSEQVSSAWVTSKWRKPIEVTSLLLQSGVILFVIWWIWSYFQ